MYRWPWESVAWSFSVWAWLPAVAVVAEGDTRSEASRAFQRRLELLFAIAIVLGIAVGVLGILLQGASAAGVSLWASAKQSIVKNTLESRFGEVWAARMLVWVALGGVLAISRSRWCPARVSVRVCMTAAALGACFLAVTPALSGHPSVQGPRGVFFPVDVVHVLGASVWVGGIACLLLALPAATRKLEGPMRTRLLLATLARFSPLALACVIAITITGVVQAYIDVRSFEGLFHSTYGALVIVKAILLLVLICFGWVNRSRIIPSLRRLVSRGESPGHDGVAARRSIRSELVVMAAVFGVTAALVGYAPPIDLAGGPFSTVTSLGPAELEMTVEPAKVGLNTVHIYLIDAKTGAQFTATKEFTVTAKLPAKGIGPLSLKANLAGPGHYVLSSTVLSPGGTWQLLVTDRVSEFEEYSRTVSVPIK